MGTTKSATAVAVALTLLVLTSSWFDVTNALPPLRGRATILPAGPIASLDPSSPFVLRLSDGTEVPQCHKPPSINNAYLDLDLYGNPLKDKNSMTLFSVGEAATYHCLPGYFAGRPYHYQIKARCVQSRDGGPYWEVRGTCSKYPKCNAPPMLHDAVMSIADTTRRGFEVGYRIEYACDDGYASTLGPRSRPFTICSFSHNYTGEWDPIEGDCIRDGDSRDLHRRLHDAQYYAEDKRVARLRAQREAYQRLRHGHSANSDDSYVVVKVLPDVEDAWKQEQMKANVQSILKRQERYFDPYTNVGPYFDQVDNLNKTKKKLSKELREKYSPTRIEPTKYDLDSAAENDAAGAEKESMAFMPEFEFGSSRAADKDETVTVPKDAPEDMPAAPVSDEASQSNFITAANIKKIDPDSVGPKFVLHEDETANAAVQKAQSQRMEDDGMVDHAHSDQKDINRDIRLDRLIHHFMEDHPQVLSRFKYEELHDHVHKVADLEGDLAIMESDEDDYSDVDEPNGDYSDSLDYGDSVTARRAVKNPYDYFGNEEGAFGMSTADCIRSGRCTSDGQPRWLSYREGRTEAKKLAHLITMQKFNPIREANTLPYDYKRGQDKRRKSSAVCDGPNCQREMTMEINPSASEMPVPLPEAPLGYASELPEVALTGVPEVYQHHKQLQKLQERLCKGDNCELRPAWGLNSKGPVESLEQQTAGKPELVRLLWPGNPEVGKSPDYEAGEGPGEHVGGDDDRETRKAKSGFMIDDRCWWMEAIKQPENLVKGFLCLVIGTYGFLMLRCFFRCKPKGSKQSSPVADQSGAASSATAATEKSGYVDHTAGSTAVAPEYSDYTESTNFQE